MLRKRVAILAAAAAIACWAATDSRAYQAGAKSKKAAGSAAAGKAAKVEVVGLTVEKVATAPKAEAGAVGDGGMMVPGPTMRLGRFIQEGTTVSLHVSLPGRTITGFDDQQSKLTAFKDDKKTDLAKARPKPKDAGVGFNFGPGSSPLTAEIGPGGHSCFVDVKGPALPATGAGRISVKADLVFRCGEGEKTAEQKDVALTDGTKITAGPVPMTVKPGQGFGVNLPGQPAADQGTTIILRTERPLAAITSVAFFDAAGQEIKSQKTGFNAAGVGENVQIETWYRLEKKVDKVGVKVTYFEKIVNLSVPVDLTVGIGL
jgi:hypothetical protein